MDTMAVFNDIMTNATDLSLATVTEDGHPDVRIVHFTYLPESHQILFITGEKTEKVVELKAHPQVAVTTQAVKGTDAVRIVAATANPVENTAELRATYTAKFPDAAKMIENAAMYVIDFTSVTVTAGFKTEVVTF
ncbi:pyridoxamine 5'-phosphate oxidase family protein [Levilactobacillus bambusae]|nr:pyridoxamine 5'-phosphate oxidase family protein [Levilactobacillus bambusae]